MISDTLNCLKQLKKVSLVGAFLSILVAPISHEVWANAQYFMSQFDANPINVTEQSATPMTMINASNDHQLYFKAYNDNTDLDKDHVIDTTYIHSFDYYGYFDSYKCYSYDDTQKRFEPVQMAGSDATDKSTYKYCNQGSATGQWSGNFLNWATMSRIDTIRKILFGGHRRIDTSTETVLERAYLPHDAHSWAKYYSRADIPKLTPFKKGDDYDCDDTDVSYVDGVPSTGDAKCKNAAGHFVKVGITLGNTTDVDVSNYQNNTYSQIYTEPPLIKVVKGNYSLWAGSERWQITWSSGSPLGDNHNGDNKNDPAVSKIHAYHYSPHYDDNNVTPPLYTSDGIGKKEYVARVQVCVADDGKGNSLIGTEKCKLYPGVDRISGTDDDNYKPVGLLQVYGDSQEMDFGMIAGTYEKHLSGGDIVKNIGGMHDEIDVGGDGRFIRVAKFASDNGLDNIDPKRGGLVNAWSLFRIIGYDANDGTYSNGDDCEWGHSGFNYIDGGRCQNWGNPFSEIFYNSLKYFDESRNTIGEYNSSYSLSGIPGFPPFNENKTFKFDESNSCARLSVVNLNSSNITYDGDEIDDLPASSIPTSIWDAADLGENTTSRKMTDYVGRLQTLYGKNYFIGEIALTERSETDNLLCSDKLLTELNGLGNAGGHCPEVPSQKGSFRVAGLAYYAHMKDIRNDLGDSQLIDTYSVALATSHPVLKIPDPSTPGNTLVTILPACINTSLITYDNKGKQLTPAGSCALVDFKIIEQKIDATTNTAKGTVMVTWEDSEWGGDYDQDMWGILSYEIDKTANKVKITTDTTGESTIYKMGFGYVIGGTTTDGFHVHSGIENDSLQNFVFEENVDTGSPHCASAVGGCSIAQGASSKTYTLGTASAELLKDPLWYASKYGGFIDSDGSGTPNLESEWDSTINDTGLPGSDRIPDTYFFASNPRELENALDRVFKTILERRSSGTAAAVVSSNVSGEGAMFQAYYEPKKKNDGLEARWIGTIQALWLDNAGLTREDCTPPDDYKPDADDCPTTPPTCGIPNGKLDDYCIDKVVETFFDDINGRTRARIYHSNTPDVFNSYSMQGVVTNMSLGGTVAMMPNSIQGNVETYDSNTKILKIAPYTMQGRVKTYNPVSVSGSGGDVEIDVDEDGNGPQGTFDFWEVTTSSGAGTGYSTTPMTMIAEDLKGFNVSPGGAWLVAENLAVEPPVAGDILTLKTKGLVGPSGEVFNNWVVECLGDDGLPNGIKAEISGASLKMSNTSTDEVRIENETAGFSTCTRVRLSTYDMQGTEDASYSDWQVSNLETVVGKGTSVSSIVLNNSGEKSFVVSPASNWLVAGDRVRVANYSFEEKELDDISYLWNGREKLNFPDWDTAIELARIKANRAWASNAADSGRYIMTWIDYDLDGFVDKTNDDATNEYVPFVEGHVNNVSYNFFDIYPDFADAEQPTKDLINYIRGFEITGLRNRTVRYSTNDAIAKTQRLGDIINSTPTVVGTPQEGFDLLYNDTSYSDFRRKYQNRRIVIYVGANDGLLHAFNGGFYNVITDSVSGERTVEYSVEGKDIDGNPLSVTQHDLGSEIWAYAPKNLLSHLQWLRHPSYDNSHVYFVDGQPRVFDANIFADDTTHPGGWGTVLVVGMNLGGGEMIVDADIDKDGVVDGVHSLRSAYVVFDITNPEEPPELLGEIPMPDASFTTVYPAVVAFRDSLQDRAEPPVLCTSTGSNCQNKWYLQFGTGPNDIDYYVSSQRAKMYLFDLKQLTTDITELPFASDTVPDGCSVSIMSPAANYKVIVCDKSGDSELDKSFMGAPSVVDWNLDFYSDTSYFGIVGDSYDDTEKETSSAGQVIRFDFNNDPKPANWSNLVTFFKPDRPVTAQLMAGKDDLDNHWLFFGTGRYFGARDKISDAPQYLFGIKDEEAYPVLDGHLLDVTDIEVYSDGELGNPPLGMTTVEDLEEEIDISAGWKLELPPINPANTSASTRNVTRSTLLGGVLFSSVFQPSNSLCEGEGSSRLYGLYYKTGTAYSDPSVFGSTIETSTNNTVRYRSNKFVELGRGFATSPALHSGSGSGSGKVKVFAQLSTGDIVQSEAETILQVRTGKTSWSDK